jgi:RNA polymerase sigma-70 factor (ECF subfamily)
VTDFKSKGKWLQSVVSQYERRLLRYTGRFVNEAEAKEVVQESYLRLWQVDPSTLEANPAPWLFTVCRNLALDRLRQASRTKEQIAVDSAPTLAADPELKLSNDQRFKSVLHQLNRLPREQQEVLRLKFQEELSYKEISAITGHSVSYVGVLIHEGMMTLRRYFQGKSEVKP